MNAPANANPGPVRRRLVKDVVLLQFKLLLGAARDLALTPVSLAAAAIDFIRAGHEPPRWLPWVLRLGERSDHWIDLWAAGRHPDEAPRENVDALLSRVEEVVRDPQSGARRARILKRWAERQVARARQRMVQPPSVAGPNEVETKEGQDGFPLSRE